MNVREVRDALKKYKKLTLGELATVTKEDTIDLEIVLNDWQAKGKVMVIEPISCGSSCCSGGSCSSGVQSPQKQYMWCA